MNAVWREVGTIKWAEAETGANQHISDVGLNPREAVGIGELFQTSRTPMSGFDDDGLISGTVLDDCRWEEFGPSPSMGDECSGANRQSGRL